MKFHRVSLRDYKAIRSFVIEPRETGVTIIEGENEVGKSSIAEALWLVFDQTDDSSSAAVRNLKPAGRDASTEVEVDVSTGQYRFTYFKRFHRGSRTELRIAAPRQETLTGREAHNRARQILDETMDRALWEALRLQQGASLEPLNAGDHQSLLRALDVAAGELLGGDREQTLFERIEQEFLRYWTSTGREKASGDGPNAPRLRRARDEAQAEAERIAARIASLEERANRSTELSDQIATLVADLERLKEQQGELSRQDEARQRLAGSVETTAARTAQLEGEANRIANQLAARDSVEASLALRKSAFDRARVELDEIAAPLAEASARLVRLEAAAAEAEQAIGAANRSAATAEEFVRLSERELQVTQMSERLARIESNEPELRGVIGWLNGCKVDRRALQEIAGAEREVERIRGLRESEGASIEISALEATALEVDGQQAEIGPDRTYSGKVHGVSTLRLPGGIVVRISAGAAARELEGALAAATAALEECLAQAGVESAQEARETWDARIKSEERRKFLMEQIRADLRDLSADALREKLERERAAMGAIRDAAQAGVPESLDTAKTLRDRALQAARDAVEAGKLVSQDLQDARSRVEQLERQQFELSTSLKSVAADVARHEAELLRLDQERGDRPLADELASARAAVDAATAKLAEGRLALAALPDVSATRTTVATELAGVERRLQEARDERARDVGVLDDAGAEGLHGLLSGAEQQQMEAAQELGAYERRATAAKRLFDTMTRRREEARENYADPMRRAIEGLGKRVFGPSFGIELSEALQIMRVTRSGEWLDVGQLSVGMREQLSVLTRLACASLVSASDGAPVVLDDVFGWADPIRLQKLGPILADAARETQVLLFTCHPRRFDSVAPARVISLPTGRVEERREGDMAPAPEVAPRAAGAAGRSTVTARTGTPQAAFDLFGEPEAAGTR
ncbi:AAA family ATPase [Candidatus Amarobacter glycogenicus]|uniref:AAA family ATPase n=1 Tax=Candidatus Amarobacter glycogenicus TaxID=3140699 RepID=UPI002A14431A|nr:AAA family ATPase [Dehalococcoidia bacterium]